MIVPIEYLLFNILIGIIWCQSNPIILNDQFVEKNEIFAVKFYNELQKSEEHIGNSLIFSPFSIQTAGALLYTGSNGITSDQMYSGFNLLSKDNKTLAAKFKQVLQQYENNPLMKIVNKIYVMKDNEIAKEFSDIAKNKFYTTIENINFNENNKAANEISEWVENNTNGKIKNFVKGTDVDADTKMFLVNAIHFKGEWKTRFQKDNTKKVNFWKNVNKSIEVDMMIRTDDFKFSGYDEISALGVEIPFAGDSLSMFILIPQTRNINIMELEKKLLTVDLKKNIFDKVGHMKITLSLPKFNIETSIDMKEIYENLNMKDMFGGNADFSKLLETDEPLELSKAIHKATIEITEEGAEAAAATGHGITFRTGPFHLNLNRPFLYFIKGNSGEVYFMGRFMGE